MKVLIILEDPTLDQHVVRPIVQWIFDDIGKAARIDVLRDPHLRGAEEALDRDVVADIVDSYPMHDVFLLVVDRDCDRQGNVAKVAAREAEHSAKLIGCLAREEVEVWMLAAQASLSHPWRDILAECDPKERFAEPFLAEKGWTTYPGRGRKRAMDVKGGLKRVLSRCEELRQLKARLGSVGATSP